MHMNHYLPNLNHYVAFMIYKDNRERWAEKYRLSVLRDLILNNTL